MSQLGPLSVPLLRGTLFCFTLSSVSGCRSSVNRRPDHAFQRRFPSYQAAFSLSTRYSVNPITVSGDPVPSVPGDLAGVNPVDSENPLIVSICNHSIKSRSPCQLDSAACYREPIARAGNIVAMTVHAPPDTREECPRSCDLCWYAQACTPSAGSTLTSLH